MEDVTQVDAVANVHRMTETEILEDTTQSDGYNLDVASMEVMEISASRKRGLDETDGWTINTKVPKKRIIRAPTPISTSPTDLALENTEICVTNKEILPKQFAFARLLKTHNVTDVNRVKYVNPRKVLLTFDNETSAENFITKKTFQDLGWRLQRTSEVGLSYGVIKNVELDISEEEMLQCISSDIEVISVKRLNRRNRDSFESNIWTESETIRLGFKGSSLPPHIYIHSMKIKVEAYVFPVTQCGNCWKFGHVTKMCPKKKRVCPKCGENHENCEVTAYKCINCAGNHMALQKICPTFIKEKRIRQLMSEFNCTYRKALTLYVPPSPTPSQVAEKIQPKKSVVRATSTDTQRETTASNNAERSKCLYSEVVQSKNIATTSSSTHKTPSKNPNNKKKKTKSNTHYTKNNSATAMDYSDSLDDDNNSDQTETRESEPECARSDKHSDKAQKSEHKDLTFLQLYTKLINIMYSKQSTFFKIKYAVSLCVEWVVSVVINNLSDLSIIKTFFGYNG